MGILKIVRVESLVKAQEVLIDGADIALLEEKGIVRKLICENAQILASIERKIPEGKNWLREKQRNPSICLRRDAQEVITELSVFFKIDFL